MSEGNSIVNFGDLSKPATVLIEKISGAIGLLYEPTQIKRVAKAEVEAEKIKALGAIATSEIQQRALARLVEEEGKKQENIESIAEQATRQLNDDAKPDEMEDDWIVHFFEKSRNISDHDMQSLWSNLLAGEANSPGSFSKRTIELVATLDKSDAHLFTTLCGFAIYTVEVVPLVLDYTAEIYSKSGINFISLNHLEAIGLLKFNSLQKYAIQHLPKEVTLHYYGTPITMTLKEESGNNFEVGHVMLTQMGQQLAKISGAGVNEEFLQYFIDHHEQKGLNPRVSLPTT